MLLGNVGSPDGPDAAAVRRFLAEFLSDPEVVRLPRVLWLPLLHGLVLPLRSRISARRYEEIWTEAGSPLVVHGRALRDRLAEELGAEFRVSLGMRYGRPSLASALKELQDRGCRKILLVPLFPQASFSTSGSVRGETERLARTSSAPIDLVTLPSFCDDRGYVGALADRVRSARAGTRVDHHLFSFHGLPEESLARGDPYRGECERTASALARELTLSEEEWTLAFQSRFGRRWLRPFTDEVARGLAQRGQNVLVATPGFAADCLETLEEIGIRLRDSFRSAGGGELIVVPALNDHPAWIKAMARLVRSAASRWVSSR